MTVEEEAAGGDGHVVQRDTEVGESSFTTDGRLVLPAGSADGAVLGDGKVKEKEKGEGVGGLDESGSGKSTGRLFGIADLVRQATRLSPMLCCTSR